MPEVTDLMRVAQWAKSTHAPADELHRETERLRAALAEAQEAYLAVIEAAELRGTVRHIEALLRTALHLHIHGEHAPGGNETWQDWERAARDHLNDADSHRDGRTPQTLGATEEQEATEAQEAAQ